MDSEPNDEELNAANEPEEKTTQAPILGSKLIATDDKPGSLKMAHTELDRALGQTDKLVSILVSKIEPVMNTSRAIEQNGRESLQKFDSNAASWVQTHTLRVQELNDLLDRAIKLVDI